MVTKNNKAFEYMSPRSKISLATIAISILIIGLLLMINNSQNIIRQNANDILATKANQLEQFHDLFVLIHEKIHAANLLIVNNDIEAFSDQQRRLNKDIEARLTTLRADLKDNPNLNALERDLNAQNLAIEHIIQSIKASQLESSFNQTLLQKTAELDQQLIQFKKHTAALHQELHAKMQEKLIAINAEGDVILNEALFLAACILCILALMSLNMRQLSRAKKDQIALSQFPSCSPDIMLTIDANANVIFANPMAEQTICSLGYRRHELKQLLPVSIQSTIAELKNNHRGIAHWNHRIAGTTFESTLRWIDEANRGHVYLHDITRSEALQKRLNYLAYFDPLTALPNRRRFEEEIDNILALNKQDNSNIWAIGLIRLDRFAHVTSGHGYNIGDKLLSACAERLNQAIPNDSDATLFRFDGARFGILTPVTQGEEVANALNSAMLDTIEIKKISFYITISIGYTINQSTDESASKLITNAGAALERATQNGGNTVCLFTDEMRTRELKWLNMEIALRQSLAAGELDVYYQPQIDTNEGYLVGMEALVRWRKPDGEYIPPSEFIPLAERIGLIVVLGEWVLHKAFAQAAQWHQEFGNSFKMAVNISTKQFNHVHFLSMLNNAIAATGVDPSIIEIEITESVMMDNTDYTTQVINIVKDMGFSIAIDDFGTGYSSMTYLKDLPIDKIKIDRSFVVQISTENENHGEKERDKAIVTSIIELSHNLNMKVIAEGVDNSEQVHFLRQAGCDYFQGFLFSKPIAAQDMEEFIIANSKDLPKLD